MEIDKINGNIAFNEKEHLYFDVNDSSKKYISVTTLIDKYCQPFDKDFWSNYKALQAINPEAFNIEKKGLLATKRWNTKILEAYGIDNNSFIEAKQKILDEWKYNNEQACIRGTKIHADIERSFYKDPNNKELRKFVKGGKFVCRKDYTDLDLEYGVYPEYLIHRESDDGVLLLAGQIDLLIKSGNDIIIGDHKTNQHIDTQSFYNSITKQSQKMKYPLNKLDDSNFWHYTMQLSTYAWMVQKINPDFVIRDLILNHYDHNGNNRIYHCEYLKSEVEKMLTHYKKQLLLEKHREKRKRIEY